VVKFEYPPVKLAELRENGHKALPTEVGGTLF